MGPSDQSFPGLQNWRNPGVVGCPGLLMFSLQLDLAGKGNTVMKRQENDGGGM